MAEAVEIDAEARLLERDVADDAPRDHAVFDAAATPRSHSIVYRINGPFFFGATQKFSSVIEQIGEKPRAYVLDFSGVPLIDSTGAATLRSLIDNAHHSDAEVFITGISPRLRRTLRKLHIGSPYVRFAPDVETAIARAELTSAASPAG
jgi:SulP family sulfate permease